LFYGNVIIPFRDNAIALGSELYGIMTTRFSDKEAGI
jgi:hypothetical protein